MLSKQTHERLEQLDKFGREEGTEAGEWWSLLVQMRARAVDFGSEEFLTEYEKQVEEAFESMLEWQQEELLYEDEENPDTDVLQTAIIASVRISLHEYHKALDRREHGGVAAQKFVSVCEEILGMTRTTEASAVLSESKEQ